MHGCAILYSNLFPGNTKIRLDLSLNKDFLHLLWIENTALDQN